MVYRAKVVLSVDGRGLVVDMSPDEAHEALSLARKGTGDPFVRLTRAGGGMAYVAADKVLYIEAE